MNKVEEFVKQRDEVMAYVEKHMLNQGLSQAEVIKDITCMYFFSSLDIECMWKCIESDLPDHVKAHIISHDYQGLRDKSVGFLPKSRQFKE